MKVTVSFETRAHVTNFPAKCHWPRRVNVELQGSRGPGVQAAAHTPSVKCLRASYLILKKFHKKLYVLFCIIWVCLNY